MSKQKTKGGGEATTREDIQKFNDRVADLRSRGYIALTPGNVHEISNGVSSEEMLCSSTAIGGAAIQNNFGMFDGTEPSPIKVMGVGTDGLGYVEWGPGNMLPNLIYNLAAATPYTAAPLKYLTDLTVGYGPALMYPALQIVNGTVKRTLIPYDDAGAYLLSRIRDVRQLIKEETTQTPPEGSTVGWESARSAKPEPGTPRHELETLLADYKEWERTKPLVDEFLEKNDLLLHYTKCVEDDTHMGICFPTVGLSVGLKGKAWQPKIVKLGYIQTLVARFEQMDSRMRINYVYHCEKWRTEPKYIPNKDAVSAYTTLMPENFLPELRRQVERGRQLPPRKRPTWFCAPIYQPSMSPYYPRQAWWSIFPSKLYDYITTLITDRATSRKNATMWGKMIFINQEYLKMLQGEDGMATEDEIKAFKNEIFAKVNEFLKRRENNGKTFLSDSFLVPGTNQFAHAIEIVDVPTVSLSHTDNEELAELTRAVCYAFGLNAEMIGSVPTKSNGGTYQRELHLMKQSQQSGRQRAYTRFLQNIHSFNGLDPKGVWVILMPTFTTLDRNPTGVEEGTTKQ